MTELLGWVPMFASFVLGIIYLGTGDGGPVLKGAGVVVFVTAAYLQLFSPYAQVGLFLQIALALTLEMWRRLL